MDIKYFWRTTEYSNGNVRLKKWQLMKDYINLSLKLNTENNNHSMSLLVRPLEGFCIYYLRKQTSVFSLLKTGKYFANIRNSCECQSCWQLGVISWEFCKACALTPVLFIPYALDSYRQLITTLVMIYSLPQFTRLMCTD